MMEIQIIMIAATIPVPLSYVLFWGYVLPLFRQINTPKLGYFLFSFDFLVSVCIIVVIQNNKQVCRTRPLSAGTLSMN